MFSQNKLSSSFRISLVLALLLAVIGTSPTIASGSVVYVQWNASGANNGTSWADAYTDLQSALATVSSGTQIWVAAGTYKPVSDIDRNASFVLKNDVAVYGGFAGTETSLPQRDYQTNITTLSGDIGRVGDNSDNAYHVVVGSDTNNTAVLDGFTITGGNANVSPSDKGGGIYNFHGSPSLANLIITGNYATFGGGMNNESFTFSERSNPNLSNVSFINNSAVEGGGMRNMSYSSPTLEKVKFQNNTVTRAGGGMANLYQNSVTMHNVEFSGNVAGVGGGLSNVYSNPILENVTFSNNSAEWGGGIANGGSNPTITNATFYGNSATTYGGAISNESYSSPILTNVTISGNSAVTYGGGIYNDYYGTNVRNSILYGNSGGDIYTTLLTANVSYSIVQGGHAGIGNLNVDPLLLPLNDNGGFTKTMAIPSGSPAIDAGTASNCPATDQRGVTRPQGSQCDIGAYEYQPVIYVDQSATGANNGSSWENAYIHLQSALTDASSGEEIWVADGTYKPGLDRDSTFALKNGVGIYGGFNGTETSRDQRDPSTYITILSGDLNGNDSANVAPDEPTRADNVIHVISSSGTTSTAVLDGFTITGGNANLEVRNSAQGGGMWNENGSPTLANIVFANNSSLVLGGGMFNDNNSQPTLTNVLFQNNVSEGGGGLANYLSSPVLSKVTFTNNYASFSGGGALNLSSSNVIYDAVTFNGNSAFSFGGGMGNYSSNPRITNSTFQNNRAFGNPHPFHSSDQTAPFGGALYNSSSDPIIENATFVGNSAGSGIFPAGSAIGNQGGNPQLYYVTIAGNYDGIMNDTTNLFIGNSIIWGNSNPPTMGTHSIVDVSGSPANVTDSIIQNGYPGTNVIDEDPKLTPPSNNGGNTQTMALQLSSAAIDRANPVYCPATDQRGVTRPKNAACDMGAFEYEWPISTDDLVRVSVNAAGEQADMDSRYASLSSDGHYVAYASYGTNLVTGDTNNAADVFVRDMATDSVQRVSVASNGAQSNGNSYSTSLSGNGHYVVFESDATNLVADDMNGVTDIFVHGMFSGTTTRVSVNSSGMPANARSQSPVISANGRYVAFESNATNLMTGDLNNSPDIFVHDTTTGTTIAASLNSGGEQGNSSSVAPSISADGRFIVFNSYATNLIAADSNNRSDIFLRDMQSGRTTLVSIGSGGVPGNGDSVYPAISSDGRYIAFSSTATNLVLGDTNGKEDIFLYDTQLNTTTRISVDSNGAQGNNDSLRPSISGDARFITFHSTASNLVANDTNSQADVFVYDRQAGSVKRVSVNWNNGQANDQSLSPFISADGLYIAFYSFATNLVTADTNGEADVFVHWQKHLPTPPTSTPTATSIASPSSTPTFTPTYTATSTPSNTPTPTNTATATATSMPSLFQPYVNFPVEDGRAVAIGDFNSDGLKDVAMTGWINNTGTLLVYLQTSNGSLASPISYAAGYTPDAMAVGDLNHDGRTDIVVTNFSSSEISIFLQQETGSLATRIIYPTAARYMAVAVGDINSDGLADIALSGNSLGVITQNASGALNPIVVYPSVGSPTSIVDIAIADVNNDGKDDVIKKHGSPAFLVYLQNENGGLAPGFYPGEMCQPSCAIGGLGTGDVTGDGLTDIVMSIPDNRPRSKIVVFAQGQDGNLQPPVLYNAYDIPEPVEIADVNQDNRADVLTAHSGWTKMGVFLQQANGTLNPYNLYSVPYASYNPSSLAIGDINNDNLPDAVIADYNSGLVVLYHSPSGSPNPATPTRVPINTPTFTPTFTSTATPTNTLTFTPTFTATTTPSNTPTFTPTFTATATPTPVVFTLTLQPDAATGADSYIYSGSKTSNFGSAAELSIGEDNNANNRIARGLIRFDLSSIPANATITSATLSLWTSSDLSSNTRTIRVYRLKVPFNESQVTWSRPATGVSWQLAGASGLNDRESVDIGSLSILDNEALNAEKQILLSPARIQELVDGTFINRGFIIVADTELNDRFNYKSSDSATASQRPKLVVQYVLGSVTPTNTPTLTPSPTVPPTTTEVSVTPSFTATTTATATGAVSTPTFTATATRTATFTSTATYTPTFTSTATNTFTPSPTTSSGFPITVVRDNFNRTNGAIGKNWGGFTTAFNVSSNQLDVVSADSNTFIFWKNTSFGTDQEAYVTLTQIDTVSNNEHSLILKSQSNSNNTSGMIDVRYDGVGNTVQVWTYDSTQGWLQRGASIPVTFGNGDQFGARARPDGTVEVYRNGTLLGTRSITGWPYYVNGGYIGLWMVNAPNALLDNFGGGTR